MKSKLLSFTFPLLTLIVLVNEFATNKKSKNLAQLSVYEKVSKSLLLKSLQKFN
jgi:hypothetical protein